MKNFRSKVNQKKPLHPDTTELNAREHKEMIAWMDGKPKPLMKYISHLISQGKYETALKLL